MFWSPVSTRLTPPPRGKFSVRTRLTSNLRTAGDRRRGRELDARRQRAGVAAEIGHHPALLRPDLVERGEDQPAATMIADADRPQRARIGRGRQPAEAAASAAAAGPRVRFRNSSSAVDLRRALAAARRLRPGIARAGALAAVVVAPGALGRFGGEDGGRARLARHGRHASVIGCGPAKNSGTPARSGPICHAA